MQAYSSKAREADPHALPDIEVFELTAAEVATLDEDMVHEYMRRHEFRLAAISSHARERMIDAMIAEEGITGGWFYHYCFPGCMPDSMPFGPFASADEALADARENAEDAEILAIFNAAGQGEG